MILGLNNSCDYKTTDSNISTICDMVKEIYWQFDNHGINSEWSGDLSITEYMTLKKASEIGEILVKDIASTVNFSRSGASRIISRLAKRGYVTRRKSPSDGRFCSIALTAKGREILEEIEKKNLECLKKALLNFDQQKVGQIKETVELLSNAIKSSNCR